jgi:hypothetical protein
MEKNKRGKKSRISVKFRRANNPRWRMEPLKGTDAKLLRVQLEQEIVKHGIITPGSYELSIKSSRGTMVTNWTGLPNKAVVYFNEYVKPKK